MISTIEDVGSLKTTDSPHCLLEHAHGRWPRWTKDTCPVLQVGIRCAAVSGQNHRVESRRATRRLLRQGGPHRGPLRMIFGPTAVRRSVLPPGTQASPTSTNLVDADTQSSVPHCESSAINGLRPLLEPGQPWTEAPPLRRKIRSDLESWLHHHLRPKDRVQIDLWLKASTSDETPSAVPNGHYDKAFWSLRPKIPQRAMKPVVLLSAISGRDRNHRHGHRSLDRTATRSTARDHRASWLLAAPSGQWSVSPTTSSTGRR